MLLEKIRAHRRLKNIPLIMVTAQPQFANINAARHAEANSYIVKPFTGAPLKKKIVAVFTSDINGVSAR